MKKYVVFVDYGPDNYVRFFNNYKDAKKELDSMENEVGFSGTFKHYLAEVVEEKKIDHRS